MTQVESVLADAILLLKSESAAFLSDYARSNFSEAAGHPCVAAKTYVAYRNNVTIFKKIQVVFAAFELTDGTLDNTICVMADDETVFFCRMDNSSYIHVSEYDDDVEWQKSLRAATVFERFVFAL